MFTQVPRTMSISSGFAFLPLRLRVYISAYVAGLAGPVVPYSESAAHNMGIESYRDRSANKIVRARARVARVPEWLKLYFLNNARQISASVSHTTSLVSRPHGGIQERDYSHTVRGSCG